MKPSAVSNAGPGGSDDTPSAGARYRAFISYSHVDTKWATWLLSRLESYRVPERFHGRVAPVGEVGPRIAPVFRDRDELPTADDLGEAVQEALRCSATLIVICSPTAARSRWVNEEVMHFKRLGRSDRVFALIVGGEPNAENPALECFPTALRFAVGPAGVLPEQPVELIAADAREHADGRDGAFLRLVAGLLGVGFDDLRQRELQRRHQRMMWITAGSVAGMAITAGLALYALQARNEAIIARNDAQRRQQQMENFAATMLNDMTTGLQKAEKLDALEAAGARIMEYFQTLNPRDLTDATLAQQAKALTQIGQIRISQLRYAEAEAAFTEAGKRCAALVERHPLAGDMLFERGQAEYWIGMMHRKRGELVPMAQWWTRYRDTCAALVKLDPRNARWQGELAWGLHNLAVYDSDRGQLDAARRGFVAELEILGKLSQAATGDVPLRFRVVDANSWLGSLEESSGNFAEAARRFDRQVEETEVIVHAESRTAKYRANLADAFALRANIHAIMGNRREALACRQRTVDLMAALVANDPKNRNWQRSLLISRVRQARLRAAEAEWSEAQRIVEEVLPKLEELLVAEPTDIATAANLATALRVQADARYASGDAAVAPILERAVELGERVVAKGSSNPAVIGELVRAHLAAGQLAVREGQPTLTGPHVQRARGLLATALQASAHWQLLDGQARVALFLGEREQAAAMIERLQKLGYVPLDPWPSPTR